MENPSAAGRVFVGSALILGLVAPMAAHLSGSPPSSQQAAPMFRARADLIEVDVHVTDRQGRFVRDVGREEFEVFEDGVPQETAALELVDLSAPPPAVAHSATGTIPSDVATNVAAADGALYVVLFDDLHVGAARTQRARNLAIDLVHSAFGRSDLAAVIGTSGRRDAGQDLTGDRGRLLAAINRMTGSKVRSPAQAAPLKVSRDVRKTMALNGVTPASDEEAGARIAQARTALAAFERLVGHLSAIRGRRKAVVWITEGFDIDMTAAPVTKDPAAEAMAMEGREMRRRLQRLIESANRANTSVYALDPRGSNGRLDEAVDNPAGNDVSMEVLLNEQKMSQEALHVMAAGTGGTAFVNTSNVERAFDLIRADNTTYYLLAYRPRRAPTDGTFRTIAVRVKRPGLAVRSRSGYLAVPFTPPTLSAPDGTSPDLLAALRDPRPSGNLAFATTAAAFKDADPLLVAVHILPGSLSFVQSGEKMVGGLELVVVPVDAEDVAHPGARVEASLPLSGPHYERVAREGFVVPVRLRLAPGRYQLRVVARDVGSGRLGSLRQDVEIADFSRPGSLSDPVLTSDRLRSVPVASRDPALEQLAEGAPAVTRRFALDDTLTVAGEWYPGEDGETARIVAVLRDAGGTVVLQQETAAMATETSAWRYRASLPLASLAPGSHVLTIEARTARSAVASRRIPFDVAAAGSDDAR